MGAGRISVTENVPDRQGSHTMVPSAIEYNRERANIAEDQEEQFKEAAKYVLALTDRQIAELLARGDFLEVGTE